MTEKQLIHLIKESIIEEIANTPTANVKDAEGEENAYNQNRGYGGRGSLYDIFRGMAKGWQLGSKQITNDMRNWNSLRMAQGYSRKNKTVGDMEMTHRIYENMENAKTCADLLENSDTNKYKEEIGVIISMLENIGITSRFVNEGVSTFFNKLGGAIRGAYKGYANINGKRQASINSRGRTGDEYRGTNDTDYHRLYNANMSLGYALRCFGRLSQNWNNEEIMKIKMRIYNLYNEGCKVLKMSYYGNGELDTRPQGSVSYKFFENNNNQQWGKKDIYS